MAASHSTRIGFPLTTAKDRSDAWARWLVGCTWCGLALLLVVCFARVSSPVPLAEDWYIVAPLTGHEPSLLEWLWAQNNEHRVPLPRLVQLGLVALAGGDFRLGGLFNIALLALASGGLILFARWLRHGRTVMSDVFFPLSLLHFGHSVQLLFPWQISFVLPIIAVLAVGCALVSMERAEWAAGARVFVVALPSLPLCGMLGMLFVPVVALIGIALAQIFRREMTGQTSSRWNAGTWLMSSAVVTLILFGLYWIGYQHPTWNPPFPGVVQSLKGALKVLAMGFGPAVQYAWAPFVAAAVIVLIVVMGWIVVSTRATKGIAKCHAIAWGLFVLNTAAFAAAVGWGRAGLMPEIGLPTRYALLAVPTFCACYFSAETRMSGATRRWLQRGLATTMIVLLPLNTKAGFTMFGNWYADGMKALRADIARGETLPNLAVHHQRFLIHWWSSGEVERHMQWLSEAGVPPFGSIKALPDQAPNIPSTPPR